MKILIKVKDLPEESIVTKKTGMKQYQVRDKVNIYSEDGCKFPLEELKAPVGGRFLVSIDPKYSFGIAVVPNNLEILWEASPDELQMFLENQQQSDVACNKLFVNVDKKVKNNKRQYK